MRVLDVGIVGFGGRGGYVAREAQRATGGLMRTVAVVDPNDARFEKGCVDYGCKPRRYPSPEEMLAEEALDVVIIGSPNEYHLENLRAMDGLDVPVFLEKPLDSTWEKINEIARFSRRYAAPIVVGHCMRYAPILQKAKQLIAQGAIGRPCSARFVQYCHYGNSMFHGWRREKERGGTMMIEKATHDIDIMQWILDARPVSVYASAKKMVYGGHASPELRCRDCDKQLSCPESVTNIMHRWVGEYAFEEIRDMDDLCVFSSAANVPDDEICVLQFDSGIHAIYTQVFYSPRSFHHRDYQIIGDEGAMDIDLGAEFGGKILLCPRYGTPGDAAEYKFDYMMRNHYNADGQMTQHLYDVVTRRIAPRTTVDQAYLAEALGYAAVVSAEQGRAVALTEIVPEDLADVWERVTFVD